MYLIVNKKGYKSVAKEIILQANPIKGEHDKYHYCYEVYVASTNWLYRGVRSSKDFKKDYYLGSSKYYSYRDDINESKRVEFRILSFHLTRLEANREEKRIVTQEFIDREDVYNLSLPDGKTWSYNRVTVRDKAGKTFSVKKNDPRYLSGELVHIFNNMISIINEEGKYEKYIKMNIIHFYTKDRLLEIKLLKMMKVIFIM